MGYLPANTTQSRSLHFPISIESTFLTIISRGVQTRFRTQVQLRRAKVRKAAYVRAQDLSVLDCTVAQAMQTLRRMQNDERQKSRRRNQLQFQSLLLRSATAMKGWRDSFVLSICGESRTGATGLAGATACFAIAKCRSSISPKHKT